MSNDKGIRLIPANTLKIVNDALSKKVFGSTIPAGKSEDTLIEHRKKKIVSKLYYLNGTGAEVKFSEFDLAIYVVCLSEQAKGNKYTTPRIIFHQLGGGYHLTDKMEKAIMESVEKLAQVRITVDMETAFKANLYQNETDKIGFIGYLLPTETVKAIINGQKMTFIHFLRDGVIYKVANVKNQFVTCPTNLLAPNIRTTPRTIALNHYLLRRSLEIKGSHDAAKKNKHVKPLRKIITFQDMYEMCDIPENPRARHQTRENVIAILNFFVKQEIIKNFSIEKKDGKFHSILIDF